jgi:hypothetical protein
MASSDRKFDAPNFDQDTVRSLALAFDYVQTELRENGKLVLMEDVLAKRIVELAENGERDPEKLCDAILTEHGIIRAEKLRVPEDSTPTPPDGDDDKPEEK